MSLTDEQKTKLLTSFFNQNLARLHGATGMERLQHGSADSADSYFVSRQQRRLEKKDFELELGDENELAATLEAFWHGTPLMGVGREMGKLAVHFRHERQRSDVSTLIYEMF